jgi:hypothetical protein
MALQLFIETCRHDNLVCNQEESSDSLEDPASSIFMVGGISTGNEGRYLGK